jgi:PAS domain S-box-containing protein
MDSIPTSTGEPFRLLVEAVQDYAIFVLDPAGHIVTWNRGAERIKGYSAQEAIGRHFSIFYMPDAVASGWPDEELKRAAAAGRFEDEGWRVRKDGTRFWANVIITRLSGPDGSLRGFAKITRDLTERRRHEDALRQSEERFRLLIEGVRDYAIFMLDGEGIVQSWNSGAQVITGYSAHEIIGKHYSVFFRPTDVRLGKPVRELKQAIETGRFEEEGWRLHKDGTVFWASVTTTAVYDAHGKLRGFAKVVRDMTERRRLEELEKSSRRMNEFLAMLGHELRNPLAPIRNSVSIMQLEPMPTQTLKGVRDVIDRQLTHLTRLVDDLLDVGRVTTGKIALQKERVAIGDVIVRSVEATRMLMDSRGHALSVDVPSEPLYVFGDVTRLAQVFQNLLNNAAKFTPNGGRIRISVETDDGTLVVSVRDTGMGISAQAMPNIFNLFAQESDRIDPGESGLGIGLTVARSIVEMHGGTIEASSEGENKGSEFIVRLPRSSATAAEGSAPSQLDFSAGTRLRVLVVDDNRDAAESLALLVRMMGHDARHVYDAASAVALAKDFRPDIALLDLAMPRVNGLELQRQLRSLDPARPMVIAAVTGLGQQQSRRQALEAGFDEFIVKPVPVETLAGLFAERPR